MIYVNAGHVKDSVTASTWQARMAAARAMGFRGVRVTFSVDQYMLASGGAVVSVPAHASQLGITAFMGALIDAGLRVLFCLSPSAPMSASWGWPWPIQQRPPETNWHLVQAALQHMIVAVRERAEGAGYDPSWIEWELPNEWYWGGPGSSTSANGGALDAATPPLADGYITAYGGASTTCATDMARSSAVGLGRGTFDTDDDWDALATFTGKTGYASVRGRHEQLQYIVPLLEFHGMRLIGSSIEADSLATTLNRNIATYKPAGYDYMDGLPVNLHLYDTGCPDSIKRHAEHYGRWFLAAGLRAMKIISAQTWAAGLPCYWTEFGFRPAWVWGSDSSGFRERERGQHWAAIIRHMQRLPGKLKALYSLQNLDAGDDDDYDFGVLTYAGNTSMGACAIAATLGRSLDPAAAPAWGGAWTTASGESPADAAEPEF